MLTIIRDFRSDLRSGNGHAWFAATAVVIATVWIVVLLVNVAT